MCIAGRQRTRRDRRHSGNEALLPRADQFAAEIASATSSIFATRSRAMPVVAVDSTPTGASDVTFRREEHVRFAHNEPRERVPEVGLVSYAAAGVAYGGCS